MLFITSVFLFIPFILVQFRLHSDFQVHSIKLKMIHLNLFLTLVLI